MILRLLTLIACVFLLSVAGGCARSAKNSRGPATQPNSGKQITSVDVVSAKADPLEVTTGNTADGTLRINVQQGYHVNANPPTYPYLVPTELQVPSGNGLSVSFIVYPDPLTRKFEFAEQPLAVYEGETPIKIRFKADPNAQKGERHLSGKLRIQACDEQVCYAPGTIDVAMPVTVK